jgi:SAM-dependent methyltransferase
MAILQHMSALADQTRCRMLLMLEMGEMTVSELCAVLQMPQSSVSRQLKTLADDGWVTSRRDGTSRFYSMPSDLDGAALGLWPLIRGEVAATAGALQDERRLGQVLAKRRATSREFFASAAPRWDALRAELFGETFGIWALLGLLDPTLVIGDLGCGTGRLAEVLAPLVGRVVAVDGSTDMLDAARARLTPHDNVEVRTGDIEALPLEADELDVALLSLVLHYLPDPPQALAEVARVVRPGGRVLVVDMLPHDRVEYQQQMGHVWLGFSEGHIARLLTDAGFELVKVRTLPPDPEARGPMMFVAVATCPSAGETTTESV